MKEKSRLKYELSEFVKTKVINTQERLALKRIPFSERSSEEHQTMLSKWSRNSDLKDDIRLIGLAYAFVRGCRYWETERFAKEVPSIYGISCWAEVEQDVVKAWLETKPSEEELASYAEHLRQAKERAREMKRVATTRAA
jgi:hypothetical protein